MDAGIADTINRRDAMLIAARFDVLDDVYNLPIHASPWHYSPIADTLLSDNPLSAPDRAWLIGALARKTPGTVFDEAPADCDWENLFSHMRAEILARRDPKTSPAHAAEIPVRDSVGSR